MEAAAASRTKLASARSVRLPGMTSRLTKGLIAAELPISRQSSIPRINAFLSAGSENVLATISMGSDGFGPVIRRYPRLRGRTTPGSIDHDPAGGEKCAVSGVEKGTCTCSDCKSGVSRNRSLFQKKVASAALFRGGIGVLYSHTHPVRR